MAIPLGKVAHEERLSLVEHLDELRSRLIVSAGVLAVVFAVCMWQNHALLKVVNHPLDRETRAAIARGEGFLGQTALTQKAVRDLAALEVQWTRILSSPGSGLRPGARAQVQALGPQITAAVARVPRTASGSKPFTLGIGEPFTTTITVTFYFALLISMPLILYEIYGFLLPAFSPDERRVALPLMSAIPALFITGVVFGYFVVLPAAVHFLQNFNSGQFNVLVGANAYYRFAALMLLAMGAIFQVPVAILAAVHAGVTTPRQLRKHRRYAIVIAAVIAAVLPGDAVTMALEMLPLVILYEASILIASFLQRRSAARSLNVVPATATAGGGGQQPSPSITPTYPPDDAL
jgi:sec-independent protein translocase protein TatC